MTLMPFSGSGRSKLSSKKHAGRAGLPGPPADIRLLIEPQWSSHEFDHASRVHRRLLPTRWSRGIVRSRGCSRADRCGGLADADGFQRLFGKGGSLVIEHPSILERATFEAGGEVVADGCW